MRSGLTVVLLLLFIQTTNCQTDNNGKVGQCCTTKGDCSQEGCGKWYGEGWCTQNINNCEEGCLGGWCGFKEYSCTDFDNMEQWSANKRQYCCLQDDRACSGTMQSCGCVPTRPDTLIATDGGNLEPDHIGDLCVGPSQSWGSFCYAVPKNGVCKSTWKCCNVRGYIDSSPRCYRQQSTTSPSQRTPTPLDNNSTTSPLPCGCNITDDLISSFGNVCSPVDSSSDSCISTTNGSCPQQYKCCNLENPLSTQTRQCPPSNGRTAVRLRLSMRMSSFRWSIFSSALESLVKEITPKIKVLRWILLFTCNPTACCFNNAKQRQDSGCFTGDQCVDYCPTNSSSSVGNVECNCNVFDKNPISDIKSTLSSSFSGPACRTAPQSWGIKCTPVNSDGSCNVTLSPCSMTSTERSQSVLQSGNSTQTEISVEFDFVLQNFSNRNRVLNHITQSGNSAVGIPGIPVVSGSVMQVLVLDQSGYVFDNTDSGPTCDTLCLALVISGSGLFVCICVIIVMCCVYRRRGDSNPDTLPDSNSSHDNNKKNDIITDNDIANKEATTNPLDTEFTYPTKSFLGSGMLTAQHATPPLKDLKREI